MQIGEELLVKPGELFPVDGVMVEGATSADESALTGESIPVVKQIGDAVSGGTLNLDGQSVICAARRLGDSALSRILGLIEIAQQQKAPAQRFTDSFSRYYTWIALSLAAVVFVVLLVTHRPIADAFYRSMTVLVVASPCALVLSVPSAILVAIAAGARRGILFRGGVAVENLAGATQFAFDKTGTLTKGALVVARIASFDSQGEDALLQCAASVAHFSTHPLARAIVAEAGKRNLPINEATDFLNLPGLGMIPGDVRLLFAKDFHVTQATLTGESLPVEKIDAPDQRENISSIERTNLCFLGTSVESGSATALIVATGRHTYFGKVAHSLMGRQVETAFDKGIKKFTWLMIRFMLVMVPLVFVINGITKHDWKEAFFFALAVAVGLTPEMLPMIVSVCLSKGAIAMSRKKVIVKRLNSIQNVGGMDVLCTDKTGTLTMDRVILEIYCDLFKNENEEVLRDAYLISHFQTGLKNILDRAVLKHADLHGELGIHKFTKLDEIPFDFSRRMMSVVVEGPDGQCQLLTKGGPEAVFAKCTQFESEGEIFEMEPILVGDLLEQVNSLNEDGLRVLAIATKKVEKRPAYSKADECDLVLSGYIAFLDPPKETAIQAIKRLCQAGVTVKVLTGDNHLVTRKVCNEVGINAEKILLGKKVESMREMY